MAVLGSTLLCLSLGLLLAPAGAAYDPDSCMLFSAVLPSAAPGIKVNTDVYESNRVYTMSVPVNNGTSSVVLRAVDANSNSSVGLWLGADQYCHSSVLYRRRDASEGFFTARWQAPPATNTTTVEIQAFVINFYRVATFSSLKLRRQAIASPSPSMTSMTSKTSMTSMTRPTTALSPPATRILTTARIQTATSTLTTARSFAHRIFLSPIADAIQILLVFLTSKLLF